MAQKAITIVLYGASSSGLRVLSNLLFFFDNSDKNIYFHDGNQEKWSTTLSGIKVLTRSEYLNIANNPDCLTIISSSVVDKIAPALDSMGVENYIFSHGLIYTDRIFYKFDEEFRKQYELCKGVSNLDADELFTLYESTKLAAKLDGDFAEVGVYKGGSARLVASQLAGKKVYLFDTFEGLPSDTQNMLKDEPSAGWLSDTTIDLVRSFVLKSGIEENNLYLFKGYFPDDTLKQLPSNTKFSIVHLDTDRYKSTIDGLNVFYNRLVSGGRIIVHDYYCLGTPGVRIAVNEFLESRKIGHLFFTVAESQCVLIKP